MMVAFNKLSAKKVSSVRKPGRYGDGLNLYLEIAPHGAKSWLFRYTLGGRAHEMGLGAVHSVSLGRARELAKEARAALMAGVDPLEDRRQRTSARAARDAKRMTFAQCADAYLAEHLSGFKNPKHQAQWKSSLKTAAEPLGHVNIAEIDTAMIIKLLTPIWAATPETGSRLRGRIEKVLDWAKARELRDGENPARWSGHLEHLLKAKAKGEHHRAMPWAEVPGFMSLLRDRDNISARALEFAILTAARTSEVLGAKWEEIDFATATWTVPASRMKSGKEHRVPLSDRTVEILRDSELANLRAATGFIFPGAKEGKPLSNMALLEMVRGTAGNGYTVHGFRSSFRDWCAERTNYPNHVAEMALAHVIGDKVEKAYRRGDLFAKRTRLMTEWAKFCEMPATSATVTPITASAGA